MLPRFPSCLVAEAVGQLAAWVAMGTSTFAAARSRRSRPRRSFLAPSAPGEMLELAVDIDDCDDDAVAYGGSAHASTAGG